MHHELVALLSAWSVITGEVYTRRKKQYWSLLYYHHYYNCERKCYFDTDTAVSVRDNLHFQEQ